MAKKETAPIYVIRNSAGFLYGELAQDRDRLLQFPVGERIRVELRTGRSPKKLRAYWAFMHKVVEATDCAPNAEYLHEVFKLLNGYTTPVTVKEGMVWQMPRSISFSSMSEEDFDEFFNTAVRWVAETYGIAKEDVDNA